MIWNHIHGQCMFLYDQWNEWNKNFFLLLINESLLPNTNLGLSSLWYLIIQSHRWEFNAQPVSCSSTGAKPEQIAIITCNNALNWIKARNDHSLQCTSICIYKMTELYIWDVLNHAKNFACIPLCKQINVNVIFYGTLYDNFMRNSDLLRYRNIYDRSRGK